ncbi:MAG: transporter related protein, partial [Bacteroidetes bacterium]|nr:transporter related protein [Bacteroidota bacterium]
MQKESKYHKTLIDLAEVLLEDKNTLSIRVSGFSMYPVLQEGDICYVEKCNTEELKKGDIIVFRDGKQLIAHRLLHIQKTDNGYLLKTRGDNNRFDDNPFTDDFLSGKLVRYQRNNKTCSFNSLSMRGRRFSAVAFPSFSSFINNTNLRLSRGEKFAVTAVYSLKNNISTILTGSEKLFRINVLISILQGLIPLAIIVCFKYLVDYLTLNTLQTSQGKLFWFALLGITGLLFLGGSVFSQLYGYFSEKLSQSVTRHIYASLHRQHVRLGLSAYENPDKQDKMHRAVQEASFRPVKILNAFLTLIKTFSSGIVLVGLFVSIRWYVFIILVQTTREREKFYYNRVLTAFPFAKELRLFGFSDFFLKRFNHTQESLFDEKIRLSRSELTLTVAAQVFAVLLIFGSLGIVSYLSIQGSMTIGAVVLFFFAFQRGYSTLNEFFRSVTGLLEDNSFLQDFIDFLNIKPEKETVPVTKSFSLEHEIRFDKVSYRYENSQRDV